MAVRYIPRNPFTIMDKKGRKRSFHPDRKGRDGTLGYTADEVSGIYKSHLASFNEYTVEGDLVVERATAAPGEKRSVKKPKDDSEEE